MLHSKTHNEFNQPRTPLENVLSSLKASAANPKSGDQFYEGYWRATDLLDGSRRGRFYSPEGKKLNKAASAIPNIDKAHLKTQDKSLPAPHKL